MYKSEQTLMHCVPFYLQFFADPDPNNAGGGGDDTNAGGGGAEPGKGGNDGKPASFDDLLKQDKTLQAEFDKRVAKALQTAREKWEKEKNMSAEELAAQKTKEKEEALAAKERELNLRELKAEAKGLLAEKKLPECGRTASP